MIEQKQQHGKRFFSAAEKHQIIQELLSSRRTKQDIWQQYTGESEEHGQLLAWMRKLGYNTNFKKQPYLVSNSQKMTQKQTKKNISSVEESFELLQLKKRNLELEKQLKEAELKAVAFSTMVDLAEKEFKIPIRKKFNSKP
jgi:transposase